MKKRVLVVGMMAVLAGCTPVATQTTTVGETAVEESSVVESSAEGTTVEDTSEEIGEIKRVGVIQLVEHTSLNIIYDSFLAQMTELGYVDGENVEIVFTNAQGDMANITSIVQSFEGEDLDAVVAITTPVAQGAMALTENIPVIFSAVTDPIAAGVVSDMNAPDKGMTGTSDAVQIDKIMELALTITPDVKSVGTIYNPGEDNSVSNIALLKSFCDANDLTLEEISISSSADLQTAASSLLEKVDMIFVSNDNTVAEAMPILVSAANAAKKPVYVGADSMVMDGGFATVGIDYTDLGKETANMVDEVLNGKSVSEIPVKVFKDDLYIYVNVDTASTIGIEIPEEITSNEKYVEITN